MPWDIDSIYMYLKDTSMLIGLQNLKSQNQLANTYLLLEEQQYLEKSSKQTCIARSTMESKFIVLDKAGEEAKWLL